MKMWLLLLALSAPGRAADLSGIEWTPHPGAPLPVDAPLREADGRMTNLREVAAGRPMIIAPGYYRCPNLCGVVRDDLLAALGASALHDDVAVAIVTIDPEETPADAAHAREGGEGRWAGAHYLSGASSALQAAAGFHARFDPAARQFLHPAGLVLATPDGRVAGYVGGVGYGAAQLEQAVADARTGALPDTGLIRLLCFHFDPATGRYTLAIEKLLRIAAAATVGIGALVLWRAHRAGRAA